jgi:uncharacterized protein (DUF952 family)
MKFNDLDGRQGNRSLCTLGYGHPARIGQYSCRMVCLDGCPSIVEDQEVMTNNAITRVFHVCSRVTAQSVMDDGVYRPASLAAEGFIHLSQRHQVQGVIKVFYADVPDLVVLVVDPARLKAPLRYEAAASMPGFAEGGNAPAAGAFPHLYGTLEADAVLEIVDALGFDA